MLNAFLVALTYYLLSWVGQRAGVFHLNRPIIVGPIIGFILGDIKTGIVLGATFESVFLGVIAVGGTIPADATVGAALGTAIAILTGADAYAALAVAVPASLVGVLLRQITSSYLPLFLPHMNKLAAENNQNGLIRYHFIVSLFIPLLTAISMFFAIWLGSAVMKQILSDVPKFLINGFNAAGAMLPAVGLAMLLNMLFNKKIVSFYFLGFVLSIYLKLPSLAVTIIAAVIAIALYLNDQKIMDIKSLQNKSEPIKAKAEDEEFFA